ncbi:hypothetical protein PhCBS80983_g04224 [Powellomyces hirtus]|uniref:Uncharacterized protein n=1 Tax=Powellomyces hirtus TaxID=109895 RepID=A0A507E0Z7_9FUNG|nr:hypothetical protein PhCBS80983_g04224 [Powellomyces hirtus]
MLADKYVDAHKTPNGPGDARPTALQIIEDEGLTGKLSDKVIFITGASSGIGVETARALHKTGAHLYFGVRNTEQGRKVADEILADGGPGKIDVLEIDLSSLESVRKCAGEFKKKSKQLNVLINNAGIMACPEGKTKDGFELQFGTNHLGHFLLFQLLKDVLLASSTPAFNSRVVSLSSSAHRISSVDFNNINFENGGYDMWKSYGQSKTANIHFSNEVDRRYGSQGLHSTSVHPGGIMTELQRHLPPGVVDSWKTPELHAIFKSPEQGAATTVWAAVSKDLEGKGSMHLDNVSITPQQTPEQAKAGAFGRHSGHADYAFDQDAELKLWNLSNKFVGFEEN